VPGWNGLTYVPGDGSSSTRNAKVQASISEADRLLAENQPSGSTGGTNDSSSPGVD